jgi:hypothetical protein
MIDILSKLTLEVLFEVVGYLNCFAQDINDLSSSQFKNSKVREVLKEEFLRVSLFNKLQNYLSYKVVVSGVDLVKWNRFLVEKEYPLDPDKKCDIFLEGQIARHEPNSLKIVYKKESLREAWIELKFFTPSRYGPAANVGDIANDFLRLIYLTEDAGKDVDVERYIIVFILCGEHKGSKKKMGITNYFGSNPTMMKLFLPEVDEVNYRFDFNAFLKEKMGNNNFLRKIKDTVLTSKNKVNLGNIDITRRILTPIEALSPSLSFSDFDKNLFGYIFKIDEFSKVRTIVDLNAGIKNLKKEKIIELKQEITQLEN